MVDAVTCVPYTEVGVADLKVLALTVERIKTASAYFPPFRDSPALKHLKYLALCCREEESLRSVCKGFATASFGPYRV